MVKNASDFDYAHAMAPLEALFVAADEPLLVYPSVAAAEQHLKAIDVGNGVYPAAYGRNGEPYRIGSEGDRVIIEPTAEPNRPDDLKSLLSQYLEGIGRTPDGPQTLDCLVETVWTIESKFWQEHDPYGDRFGTRIPAWGCVALVVLVAGVIWFAVR